jgi:hypothetical protein
MLDSNACPGPRRSRLSPHRLFHEFEIHFGDKPEAYAQVTLQQMQVKCLSIVNMLILVGHSYSAFITTLIVKKMCKIMKI